MHHELPEKERNGKKKKENCPWRVVLIFGGVVLISFISLGVSSELVANYVPTNFDLTSLAAGNVTSSQYEKITSNMELNASSHTPPASRARPQQRKSTFGVDFERQDGIVVATKIHGLEMDLLKQMLCLFRAAYNQRMQYDIVVFSTMPVSDQDRRDLMEVTHPAHLTIEVDKLTLQDHLNALNDERRQAFLDTCNDANTTEQLTWHHRCQDGRFVMPIAYNWQAEFRSKHVWVHPALTQYKYMMWLDSDALATKVWKQDPVAVMVKNDLVILFDNFPWGKAADDARIRDRIQKSFNKSLCSIKLVNGHFSPSFDCKESGRFSLVHGFFHLTSLDFFRSEAGQRWTHTFIGDDKFSRVLDDQLAVTVAPAVLAPNRSWDMWSNGINLTVFHNGMMDGKRKWKEDSIKIIGGGWQRLNFPKRPSRVPDGSSLEVDEGKS